MVDKAPTPTMAPSPAASSSAPPPDTGQAAHPVPVHLPQASPRAPKVQAPQTGRPDPVPLRAASPATAASPAAVTGAAAPSASPAQPGPIVAQPALAAPATADSAPASTPAAAPHPQAIPASAQPAQAAAPGVARAAPPPAVVAPAALPAVAPAGSGTALASNAVVLVTSAVPRPAAPSRLRPRHMLLICSFLVMVVLPILLAAWYLWVRAADQYASTTGFSVHREDRGASIPGLGALGGLASLAGASSSSDSDVIYNYIYSQQVLSEMQSELNLGEIWSRPQGDPYFTYDPSGSIEDLMDYWRKMVSVYYDKSTGMIEVRALAFTPEDAQKITTTILRKSGEMINRLNKIAAEDAVRFAQDELDKTHQQLLKIRQEVAQFRSMHQLIDPSQDLVSQTAVLAALEQELAGTLIEYDMLRENAPAGDHRLKQIEIRQKVIESRIAAERAKVGSTDQLQGAGTADLVDEWERLSVDREFIEASYTAARAGYEAARASALRQSRYLAPHVMPTLAQTSRFPEREKQLATLSLLAFMLWSVFALVYYSIRDRR